jgi:cytochrome c553
MNTPNLGVSSEDPGKFVLGTVPVEKDGSAHFLVPTGVPVFFQAIGRDGLAIQTMRSLTYVQPNQTLSCIGCHESRDAAPSVAHAPMAAARAPSKLTPDPNGAWPLRFDVLVQPVLDKHCVSCHSPAAKAQQPHATDLAADSAIKAERAAKAAKFDLSPAHSYKNLLAYGDNDLRKLAYEKDRSVPGQCPASQSKLLALLTGDGGHEGLHLDADSRYRLAVWMDTYAQVLGSFSKQQEDELRQFKQKLAGMLAE